VDLCSRFEGGFHGGFEADGADEGVEIVDDALIEAIELGSPFGIRAWRLL